MGMWGRAVTILTEVRLAHSPLDHRKFQSGSQPEEQWQETVHSKRLLSRPTLDKALQETRGMLHGRAAGAGRTQSRII